ncbi:hypothetical protein FZEAL_5229 [Fusarium zealandicum]|uniref:Uncharacterized protein n=1 Tax=Fusarium zealandicum TaxID=1053134 RepID=A0A8H4UK53_9HYPO|nr:hypothetical protein FZEAL_5229 [Fusarium zealandicum]
MVSDGEVKSHCSMRHKVDNGAEIIGLLVIDCRRLKKEGRLTVVPARYNAEGKSLTYKLYRVDYEVLFKRVDRDMKCLVYVYG